MPKPTILAYVSGKGGAGKTILAVAAAYELSKAHKTLLVDLDFYNRGLSGLFEGFKNFGSLQRPSFLEQVEDSEPLEWSIAEVSDGLFSVVYEDLTPGEMHAFATLKVQDLESSLRTFVLSAAAAVDCDYVILDCH